MTFVKRQARTAAHMGRVRRLPGLWSDEEGSVRRLLVVLTILLAACAPSPSIQATPTASALTVTPSSAASLAPSPTADQISSAGPTVPPLPSGDPVFSIVVPLDANHAESVAVYDRAVNLTGARSATAGEQRLVEPQMDGREVGATQGASDHEVVLVWIGTICDTGASIIVHGSTVQIIDGPRPACDAMAVGRGVTLEFSAPTAASALLLEYFPGRIAG